MHQDRLISESLVFVGALVCVASALFGWDSVRQNPVNAHQLFLAAVAPCLVLPGLAYLHAMTHANAAHREFYFRRVCQCVGWIALFEVLLLLVLTCAMTLVMSALLLTKS